MKEKTSSQILQILNDERILIQIKQTQCLKNTNSKAHSKKKQVNWNSPTLAQMKDTEFVIKNFPQKKSPDLN